MTWSLLSSFFDIAMNVVPIAWSLDLLTQEKPEHRSVYQPATLVHPVKQRCQQGHFYSGYILLLMDLTLGNVLASLSWGQVLLPSFLGTALYILGCYSLPCPRETGKGCYFWKLPVHFRRFSESIYLSVSLPMLSYWFWKPCFNIDI